MSGKMASPFKFSRGSKAFIFPQVQLQRVPELYVKQGYNRDKPSCLVLLLEKKKMQTQCFPQIWYTVHFFNRNTLSHLIVVTTSSEIKWNITDWMYLEPSRILSWNVCRKRFSATALTDCLTVISCWISDTLRNDMWCYWHRCFKVEVLRKCALCWTLVCFFFFFSIATPPPPCF